MKKRFVVAHVDFFNNHLTQEIVFAETEQEARWLHTQTGTESGWAEHREQYMGETADMNADDFQQWCFNGDFLVSVMEVEA